MQRQHAGQFLDRQEAAQPAAGPDELPGRHHLRHRHALLPGPLQMGPLLKGGRPAAVRPEQSPQPLPPGQAVVALQVDGQDLRSLSHFTRGLEDEPAGGAPCLAW